MAINVGIIGLGYWGPNLLRNFCTVPESKVIICCDIKTDRCQKFAMLYPGIKFTKTVDDVFNNPEVEAVAIATPTHTHYTLVKQALSFGKHVLIAKPFTSDVTQAQELACLANEKDLVLLVDHTFIYHPAVEKLRNIIVRGELGDLYYFDSVRTNLGLFRSDTSVIWDLAAHDISIMEYLIGSPVQWVQAVGACHAGQKLESMAYITVQFANNVMGHCHVNWLTPMKIRLVMVGGSRRMAVYDDNIVTEKVKIYDKGVTINNIEGLYESMIQYRSGDMYAPAINNTEALSLEVKHFLHCIKNHRQPLTDSCAGLRVVQILAAAQKSLRNEGKRIELKRTNLNSMIKEVCHKAEMSS